MSRIIENNQVTICGEIVSGFTFSHEFYGERFYLVDVQVARLSEIFDIIPVMVSERSIDVNENLIGVIIKVEGQFRSYNSHENEKYRLILSVFAQTVEFVEKVGKNAEANKVFLDGYICKAPVYRKTPSGREITDLLLAVNRPYGKSDYIPCICWGRNADYVSGFEVGTRLGIYGRIQSREYAKKLEDGSMENKVAYEVSVSKLEVLEDEE